MDILSLENATVYRGQKMVFDQLSLQIRNGQNTAIVGPNGAGKTTLLKLLARELYPASGVVSIFGKQRWNVWKLRKRLGLVSADLQKNYAPIAKGIDVVLSGFYSSIDVYGHQSFSNEQTETAKAVSQELGIEHLGEKPFSKMSTGEQRRHLLARALVNQPEALVLDEPTSGLDIPATFHYLERVRNLMQQGKTLILVTHHIHEIPPGVSHVVLLKDGEIIDQGEKAAMLTNDLLGNLFDVRVEVVNSNGYFQVVPAE